MYILTTLKFPKNNYDFHLLTTSACLHSLSIFDSLSIYIYIYINISFISFSTNSLKLVYRGYIK